MFGHYFHRRRGEHLCPLLQAVCCFVAINCCFSRSYSVQLCVWGTQWCSWLRHCAARRNVAGSIPDGVIGIFHWHNPSGRTMILESAQPLTEMSSRNICGGKGGRCVGLTNLPPTCVDFLEVWEPRPPGTPRACPGMLWGWFTLYNSAYVGITVIIQYSKHRFCTALLFFVNPVNLLAPELFFF